jgi:hypothetical protein
LNYKVSFVGVVGGGSFELRVIKFLLLVLLVLVLVLVLLLVVLLAVLLLLEGACACTFLPTNRVGIGE